MSEFDKWFEGEMPNSYKKVNKERIETVIYSCAEASWDHQQAKIDELKARVDKVMKYIEPSDELSHKAYRDLVKILKGNKDD